MNAFVHTMSVKSWCYENHLGGYLFHYKIFNDIQSEAALNGFMPKPLPPMYGKFIDNTKNPPVEMHVPLKQMLFPIYDRPDTPYVKGDHLHKYMKNYDVNAKLHPDKYPKIIPDTNSKP
jgi:hypothetical protein